MKDLYLQPGKSYDRLYEEYRKYGSLVIGYDFDNTVYNLHQLPESFDMVAQLIRDLKEIGCKVICWTATNDLGFVKQYLEENEIPYDGINTNGIELPWDSRKPFYSAVLDDRAGLIQVYNELSALVFRIISEDLEKEKQNGKKKN